MKRGGGYRKYLVKMWFNLTFFLTSYNSYLSNQEKNVSGDKETDNLMR